MKKQFLCGVAAGAFTVALGGASFAADLPVKAAPAPMLGCIWNGFYVGGHIGYGENRAKGTFFGDSNTNNFKHGPRGLLGGVQVGQNWCQNTFVYGWEGDVSFMNWKQTYNHTSDADSLTNKMNLLASLRLRLGTTIDPRTMVYLTFGPSYARGSATFFDEGVPITLKSNFDKFGGVVGLGIDYALTLNWLWRIEALYYIFNGNLSFNDGTHSADVKVNNALALRLGLSYKFGDVGKAPVSAGMPVKAFAAPAFDWSGFYVGGDAGWQASRIGLSDPTGGGTITYKPLHDSFAVGGHVGAQRQLGQLVLGVEGAYVTGFGQSNTLLTPSISIFTSGGTGVADARFEDAWSVGGRAGWSMGRWMPYVTAGWAKGAFGFHANDGTTDQTASIRSSGPYFGGGVEIAYLNNWIFGIEYRYYDFKAKNTIASNGDPIRLDPNTETLMARLSYKFDWGKGPIVAKY